MGAAIARPPAHRPELLPPAARCPLPTGCVHRLSARPCRRATQPQAKEAAARREREAAERAAAEKALAEKAVRDKEKAEETLRLAIAPPVDVKMLQVSLDQAAVRGGESNAAFGALHLPLLANGVACPTVSQAAGVTNVSLLAEAEAARTAAGIDAAEKKAAEEQAKLEAARDRKAAQERAAADFIERRAAAEKEAMEREAAEKVAREAAERAMPELATAAPPEDPMIGVMRAMEAARARDKEAEERAAAIVAPAQPPQPPPKAAVPPTMELQTAKRDDVDVSDNAIGANWFQAGRRS